MCSVYEKDQQVSTSVNYEKSPQVIHFVTAIQGITAVCWSQFGPLILVYLHNARQWQQKKILYLPNAPNALGENRVAYLQN